MSLLNSLNWHESIPGFGPLQGEVGDGHHRTPSDKLAAGSPPRIEHGVVAGAGKGVLAVGGEAVADDALLLP